MANESNIKDQLKVLFKEHDYNKLYYKSDIVSYYINGTTNFYQAIRNVPRHVSITDRSYWNLLTTGNEPDQPTRPDYLCFTANKAGATLMLYGVVMNYDGEDFALEYSTDEENWENLEITKEPIDGAQVVSYAASSSILTFSSEGDKVYFRGNNTNGSCNIDLNKMSGYFYAFCGDPATNTKDNEFSVTGDLQTIVDKTGKDKEHGCFGNAGIRAGLFTGIKPADDRTGILITSAPDLTATTLIPSKYSNLFANQTLLEEPANMPEFTINDFPTIESEEDGCFFGTYAGCTSLQHPANFNSVATNDMELKMFITQLRNIYVGTTFNITEDQISLIGFNSLNLIINEHNVAYEAAELLGNTNGFVITRDILISSSNDYRSNKAIILDRYEMMYEKKNITFVDAAACIDNIIIEHVTNISNNDTKVSINQSAGTDVVFYADKNFDIEVYNVGHEDGTSYTKIENIVIEDTGNSKHNKITIPNFEGDELRIIKKPSITLYIRLLVEQSINAALIPAHINDYLQSTNGIVAGSYIIFDENTLDSIQYELECDDNHLFYIANDNQATYTWNATSSHTISNDNSLQHLTFGSNIGLVIKCGIEPLAS